MVSRSASVPFELAARMIAAMCGLAVVYSALGAFFVLAGAPVVLVALAAVSALVVQWLATERMTRRMTRARELTPRQDPELHAVLDRLCALTDQAKPRVAITSDPVPNAFTVGRSRRHATIILSRGLRERLSGEEVDAVLAHELAHIAHRDVAVMTVASSLAIALAWASRTVLRVVRRTGLSFAGGSMIVVGGVVGAALVAAASSVLAHLPLRALSRYRELAADRTAALTLGQPAHLSAALVKASGMHGAIPDRDLRAAAVPGLGFVGPPSRFGPLFCTHPPLDKRLDQLARLQRSAF